MTEQRAAEILDRDEVFASPREIREACYIGRAALLEKLVDRYKDKVAFSDLGTVRGGLMMVWAAEPGRGIRVEMTYDELRRVMEALDREREKDGEHWEVAIGYDPRRAFQCSRCSKMAFEPSEYCPHCGARMDKKED